LARHFSERRHWHIEQLGDLQNLASTSFSFSSTLTNFNHEPHELILSENLSKVTSLVPETKPVKASSVSNLYNLAISSDIAL
jgi:hypothetical protein